MGPVRVFRQLVTSISPAISTQIHKHARTQTYMRKQEDVRARAAMHADTQATAATPSLNTPAALWRMIGKLYDTRVVGMSQGATLL